ncbi:putative yir4 protein [Plasmodium yoelii yoelii]|uniref:Yir4 protein n=1 Tax=Plasmodium yoelii yoelii TaxID=73239 RepID=Q7R7L0_PLAYO|nr:putative yir4 protein [Plasmodium yoelii yoelii]
MDKKVCKKFQDVRGFLDELDNIKKYCNNNCNSDLRKINVVCLHFVDDFFGRSSSFKNHNNINIVDYIMIWLSYMLNLIENNSISNLQYFYDTYIKNDRYNNNINCVSDSNEFVAKYNDLNKYPNITNESPYNKILSTLSTDYDNFEKYCGKKGGVCSNFPSIPVIKSTKLCTNIWSYIIKSTGNKLFIVLSILGVIAIFCGISYKVNIKN